MVDIKSWSAEVAVSARAGNFWPLIAHLEYRFKLTPELRHVLIQILQGKVKRSRRRPKDHSLTDRNICMSFEVACSTQAGVPVEAAVKDVGARYRVSDRTVYAAMSAWPNVDAGLYEAIATDEPQPLWAPGPANPNCK
jgi:hypothetical protein